MHRLGTRLLAALVLALALAAPSAAVAGAAPSDCRPGPAGVPQKAYDTAEYVRSHGGAAPPGHVGGRTFQNREGHLDNALGPFREYDVNPQVDGQNRGPQRLVLGPSRAASYYTPDHYSSFITLYGDGCTG